MNFLEHQGRTLAETAECGLSPNGAPMRSNLLPAGFDFRYNDWGNVVEFTRIPTSKNG